MEEESKITVKPLEDRVLVKIRKAPDKVGSIIIPDNAQEKPMEGTVEAVGPGKVTPDGEPIPMYLQVGDKVLFTKYAGNEIKEIGEDYLIMREGDVLARLEPGV